ncbi:MAG TPA: lytic transglycosylase domain-containing protein [Syntrophomonadaceae bacterium]|nr:lytic transglycosylase domain-containing protein [Syntrophomonadaceae bacterium]
MKIHKKSRLPVAVWLVIILFLIIVLTFPKWITIFYPQPHRDIIFSTAYKHDVDPYLVFAIIRVESKYQVNAQSSAGAMGLMQIMPETAQWIAKQQNIDDFDLEDLYDAEININFGIWYISNLTQEYKEPPLIIAAYNAGRGRVNDWQNDEIWDGNRKEIGKIPFPETRDYVKSVLKNYEAYKAIYL